MEGSPAATKLQEWVGVGQTQGAQNPPAEAKRSGCGAARIHAAQVQSPPAQSGESGATGSSVPGKPSTLSVTLAALVPAAASLAGWRWNRRERPGGHQLRRDTWKRHTPPTPWQRSASARLILPEHTATRRSMATAAALCDPSPEAGGYLLNRQTTATRTAP